MIVKWNRDWTRVDRIWRIFLIPGNHLLLWQGIACHGKCKFLVSAVHMFLFFFIQQFKLWHNCISVFFFFFWYLYITCLLVTRYIFNSVLFFVHLIRYSSSQGWHWPLDWSPLCSSSQNAKTSRFNLFISLFPLLYKHTQRHHNIHCLHALLPLFSLALFFLIVQGTISFGVGFFLVVIGWPILGMILEAYGFIVLFRSVGFLLHMIVMITHHSSF